MTKKASVINIILSCAVALFAALYLLKGSLSCKATASISFMLLGIINYTLTKDELREYSRFSVLLLSGLFMAMLGDIIINHSFIAGAAAFAIGHVFFFVAQYHLCPPDKRAPLRDLICWIGLFAANLILLILLPLQFSSKVMFVVCILYAAIISAMTGKAISNLIGQKDAIFRYILLGTMLFMLSDITLVMYRFMVNADEIHYISITLYYAAEIILADSFLMLIKESKGGG